MKRSSFLKYVIALLVISLSFPAIVHSQTNSKQILPGIFREENIQYKKPFVTDGKNYVLYFMDTVKRVRDEKNIVTDIFLVPDDYSLIRVDGENQNYPPRLKKFLYHDLGDPENKDYGSAILHDRRCDENGDNSEFRYYEIRLPDEVTNDIIRLVNGELGLEILDNMATMFGTIHNY